MFVPFFPFVSPNFSPLLGASCESAPRSLDFDGHPQKYEDLKIMSDVVAKEVNILKVDVPRENGRGWKRTAVELKAQDIGDGWREGMAAGSKYVIQETWVKANDPHFDAKALWTATPAGVGKQGGCPGAGVGWGAGLACLPSSWLWQRPQRGGRRESEGAWS